MMAIGLFNVKKKLEDFSEKELNDFLYADRIPVEKKHGAGTYTKNYEGVIRKLERLHINKAEDELSNDRKNAYQKYFSYGTCPDCKGSRLNDRARSVRINGKNIAELSEMELTELDLFLSSVEGNIAMPMVTKMRHIMFHLIEVGVGYLSLNRSVSTLSGGESQRVKMARQLDCDLVDMMYVLDEPSIGLHPGDINKLINMLNNLKEKGNSVFVVEHEKEIIKKADHIIDIGPEAGVKGGNLIFNGAFKDFKKSKSITNEYLNRKSNKELSVKNFNDFFELNDVNVNNLKNVCAKIPKGVLTCVTGVAGSGKSSLINEYFVEKHSNLIVIDQSPVGASIRSNPATYTGSFDIIRKVFSDATDTPKSMFSFNSKGACPKCKGRGFIEFEMNFLDDVKIICDECDGKRYTNEVLKLKYNKKNIYEVLKMTVNQAERFFSQVSLNRKLKVLQDVGLGYLEIGQALSTLSGGEAQRIKLASELHKKGNIYVMDEPTTGLHPADIDRLLKIIKRLVDNKNTVIIIEHNLDIICHADWIIDLGPEGGVKGGEILYQEPTKGLLNCKKSYTGKYLKDYIEN